jgi:hypothetical protein
MIHITNTQIQKMLIIYKKYVRMYISVLASGSRTIMRVDHASITVMKVDHASRTIMRIDYTSTVIYKS